MRELANCASCGERQRLRGERDEGKEREGGQREEEEIGRCSVMKAGWSQAAEPDFITQHAAKCIEGEWGGSVPCGETAVLYGLVIWCVVLASKRGARRSTPDQGCECHWPDLGLVCFNDFCFLFLTFCRSGSLNAQADRQG